MNVSKNNNLLDNQKDLPNGTSGNKPKKRLLFIGVAAILLCSMLIIGLEFLGYLSILGIAQKEKKETHSTEVKEIGPIVNMQAMTVNLKEEDGRHYLRIKIALEVANKKWVEEVQSKMSILNDLVIMVICEKGLIDLKNSGFKDQLKEELLQEMNRYFPSGQLKKIFFEEFLYQ